MNKSPTRKKKPLPGTAARMLLYVLMTLSVIVIVTILVLVVRGYRFNSFDGRLEQGGLLQYDSRPSGAEVFLGDTRLANRTANKVTVSSGEHVVTMKKSGYKDWSKRVAVVPGSILWLNYTRLVPEELKTEPIKTYPELAGALPSGDRKYMAIVPNRSSPQIDLVSVDANTPRAKTVTIADDVLSEAAAPESQQITVHMWDHDNRYVLVSRAYDDTREWFVVDMRGNEKTTNITTSMGVDIEYAEFGWQNNRIVYVKTANAEVRRLDITARSMSGPLVSNVAEFSQYDASTVTYVSRFDEQTKQRTVGYLTEGASKPRTLRTYTEQADAALQLRIGKYFGKTYVAIAHGEMLDIMTGELLGSGSDDPSALTQVASLTVPAGVDRLGVSSRDARFIYAENTSSISVYDLELETFNTTPIDNASGMGVTWLDREHFSTSKDDVVMYDFDGTNKRHMLARSLDFPAMISANDKYFYGFVDTDDGPVLMRCALLLE